MKVLFLDIDGVVNCATTRQQHRGTIGIDPYLAFLVGNAVDKLGLKVVLSSSWRLWKDGIEEVERSVCKIIDKTPSMPRQGGAETMERGHEIKAWLDNHPEVTKYAILDDDSDMLPEQLPNFFKTSWQQGVTEEIINKLTEHFSEETTVDHIPDSGDSWRPND